MFSRCTLATCVLLLSFSFASAAPPGSVQDAEFTPAPSVISNETYIDANSIMMFISNQGNFGWDMSTLFNNSWGWGTYYPYIDTSLIGSGELTTSPLYGAGLWLGGIDDATGDTLVTVSEFNSEFWPGPMVSGSYDPDAMTNEYYRMYKLFKDSAVAHPNQDYLDYVNYAAPQQGAPLAPSGNPLLLGDQTLWGVFNDANQARHSNPSGGTYPLGVEVQLSAWASSEPGKSASLNPDAVYYDTELDVTQIGNSAIDVNVWAADPSVITGDNYVVSFDDGFKVDTIEVGYLDTLIDTTYFVWRLDNVSTGQRLLEDQSIHAPIAVVEGLAVSVSQSTAGKFACFEVVSNADGPLDPVEAGAAGWVDFPVPTDEEGNYLVPTESQQATADGLWLFHTADNGGTCAGGTRATYEAFLERTLRWPTTEDNIGDYDYEMRFTGSYDNPEVDGGYAVEAFNDDNAFWVPFELWRTGIGTPDNPTDDVRLVPLIIDDYGVGWYGDDRYGLESWGCIDDETGSGDGEHSVSGGDNDPFTDWVYWYLPADDSPGEAGYLANEAQMLSGTWDGSLLYGDGFFDAEILPRTVLVNWNGGIEPPFTQDCPEQGTVIRITTVKELATPGDIFTFTSEVPPHIVTGVEGQSIYLAYKLYNKGGKTLRDCYFSMWIDPDLGSAHEDFVGCDTLNDLFFCYNALDVDSRYGYRVPAIGFKYLYGPMVSSSGDSAYFGGKWVGGHKNLGLTSFMMFMGGTDPQNYVWTYQYMNGLDASMGGIPLPNGTKFYAPGDPVTGEGDLDIGLAERRMFGTSGPFDLNPGDSQYVLVKMAVAQGTNRLNSITRMREILDAPFELKIPGPNNKLAAIPDKFAVAQNYPNPFNMTTAIGFSLPRQERVTVDIYNILGQRVRKLLDESKPAGIHSVEWDGTDQSGGEVSTGVYFYRVRAGDMVEQKKMLLLK